MKLILKNIGLLESAEVQLNSLTVIAGENDNGKSTIGKVVFCLIKAINRYREDLEESKEYRIDEKLRETFFNFRRLSQDLNHDSMRLLEQLREVATLQSDSKITFLQKILEQAYSEKILNEESIVFLGNLIQEIKNIEYEQEDEKKSIERALNKVFASEFDSNILLNQTETGEIKLLEGELPLIQITISKGNKIHLLGDVQPIQQEDVTFIESPLILNQHDLLIRSKSGLDLNKRNTSRLGIPYTTLHLKDLFDKLREPPFGTLFDEEVFAGFDQKIERIINGTVVYDNKEKDFVYKKNGTPVSIKNTASGVKVFGLLRLLSVNSFLKKNTFLVFDEPENHLHPKWQLALAELLVEMAQNGVCLIVSTHSPYMVEALKRYSDKALLNGTKFLFAENRMIENKDRLSDIFTALSEPFEVFRNMDSETLRDE